MEGFHTVLEFLKAVVMTTLNQLIGILGIFFVAGIILYFLARFTRNTFVKSAGRKLDIVITGWLGTPVHEIGHAFFCLVFMHRINKIRLYQPNSADGSLGYVNHSYNPKNYYQKIGNLFIGAGPIIFGAFVLYAVMYYLLPNSKSAIAIITSHDLQISNIMNIADQLQTIYSSAEQMLLTIFSQANFQTIEFWIFLYISVCIASHMELSPPDIKGMWSGLVTLIVLLLVVNFLTLLFGFDITTYVFKASKYTGMFFGLYIYAIIISFLNFIVSFVLLSLYTLVRYGRLFNPI